MSYIGNEPPDIGAYGVESFDGGGTSFTLSKPSTTATVLLFIDGVRQTPVDAYSVSGVTLTTTGTTPAGTDNVTVQFLGDVVDFGEPSDDSVSTVKIQDDAVTAAKLANSINTEIAANTAKVTNATHTGDVTGATALTIAADAVDIAMLSATGTADATTFLRGDNSWVAAGGDNTPAFMVTFAASGSQSVADSTNTKVEMSAEVFDTDNTYDSTTNYRWTPGVVAKYHMGFSVYMEGNNQHRSWVKIYKNGSVSVPQTFTQTNHPYRSTHVNSALIDVTDVADYFEVWTWIDTTDSSATAVQDATLTFFWGYKVIT